MSTTSRLLASSLLTFTTLLATASSAVAQSLDAPRPADGGPLVLTPIQSSIVFSPDVKVSTVNDKTAVLTGGYIGKLTEKIVFVGAGAYWLAEPREDARLFYGGLMMEARVLGTNRLNLSARGLLGAGQGTVYQTGTFAGDARHPFHGVRPDGTFRIAFQQYFLVAEPEIRFSYEVGDSVSVNLGAGYRVTSADGGFGDRMRGATASVGVQFDLH